LKNILYPSFSRKQLTNCTTKDRESLNGKVKSKVKKHNINSYSHPRPVTMRNYSGSSLGI
jgi:hypothetical protein